MLCIFSCNFLCTPSRSVEQGTPRYCGFFLHFSSIFPFWLLPPFRGCIHPPACFDLHFFLHPHHCLGSSLWSTLMASTFRGAGVLSLAIFFKGPWVLFLAVFTLPLSCQSFFPSSFTGIHPPASVAALYGESGKEICSLEPSRIKNRTSWSAFTAPSCTSVHFWFCPHQQFLSHPAMLLVSTRAQYVSDSVPTKTVTEAVLLMPAAYAHFSRVLSPCSLAPVSS